MTETLTTAVRVAASMPTDLRLGAEQERRLRAWPKDRIRPKSVALGVISLLAEVDALRAENERPTRQSQIKQRGEEMSMNDERKIREGWAVVQQMGHVTMAGYVTETTLAGFGVLSVAIPDGDRMVEQLIPPSTLYSLTWVGEAEARSVAKKHPVQVIDDWTIREETRQKIEAEERERIENRVRRTVEREASTAAGEERARLLDILSDAKATARDLVGALPAGSVAVDGANKLIADIVIWCEESHQRLRDKPRAATHASDGYEDDRYDDDDEPPI